MKIDLCGVPADDLPMSCALRRCRCWLRQKHSSPKTICTLNAEMLCMATKYSALRHALRAADLVTADGVGTLWAARILGRPMKCGKVAGVALAEHLLALAAAEGYRVFFLGGKPGVACQAAARMRRRWPELQVAGTMHGYFPPEENDAVIRRICDAGTDILLVCFGSPTQELWMDENRDRLNVRLMGGFGGSIDLFAGIAQRAPKPILDLQLEWLWRVCREPRRIQRLSGLPSFYAGLLWRRLSPPAALLQDDPLPHGPNPRRRT